MLQWIVSLFTPATKLVESLDLKGNQKQQILNELARIQSEYSAKIIELEQTKIETHAKLVEAESKSEHWIVYTWRPLCSVFIVIALGLSAYGIGSPSEGLFDLASIILGGTIGGRSIEKIAKAGGLGAVIKGK